MKLQFDPNQGFQREAVAAVLNLFDGQPQTGAEFSVVAAGEDTGLFAGQERTELGVGNQLRIDHARLLANARAVQERGDIELADPRVPLESWDLLDPASNTERDCPHFSVEMETGTGKTYVYLRTVYELASRYGLRKFIVVVPSVAIREGVLKNIEITRDHFRALYNNLTVEPFVYDAKRINRLRQFATSTHVQLMVINIDAFRKNFTGTDAEQKSNVIYKESDRLSGRQPIEFIQAARPIVIVDEPQSVDSTDRAQEAIKALNPLCTLRYSATHRNPYNLVYRLDPVRAYELRLVKQIIVADAAVEGGVSDAFVRVEKIDNSRGIKAKLRILVQGVAGPKEKSITVKLGADLFGLSEERACYRDGYNVAEINAEPGSGFVRFANGTVLAEGQETGGLRDDVWKAQIRHTIKSHLEKELQVRERGIKVLSLFFIDRVANYRSFDEEDRPQPGKFAQVFEQAIADFAAQQRYAALEWLKQPVERLHNGYFSQDKKGVPKDTRGNTEADNGTYSLIMREKERLLSTEEPLRFIFSHSALREGWDNPNVFQICTLNETTSVVKKRQELGRGLRLPVDQSGQRVFDESINKLMVVANESYEDFARALQSEYEQDCGVSFGKVPLSALAKLTQPVAGEPEPQAIGREAAQSIHRSLVAQGFLDVEGRIQPAFDPRRKDFVLTTPAAFKDLTVSVIDLLNRYRIELHVRRERDEGRNKLRKDVQLSPEFKALWDRIKPRTTYRVEFSTDALVERAVAEINRMPKIDAAVVRIRAAGLEVAAGGVTTRAHGVSTESTAYAKRPLPDVLAYLQNETELTRATIARILIESGRLAEFFVDSQRFMDAVALILRHELRRLLVDDIKYERLPPNGPDAEWEMIKFRDDELFNQLSAIQVGKSVYEYVEYDSEIEREFATQLNDRQDIKLFVKLPSWFFVDTPLGHYNPDWAIIKHDDQTLYLVRETKSTKDFLKLRTSEADKVRCGAKHFDAIGVGFAVAVSAEEV